MSSSPLHTPDRCDVIVVGGRAAGAATAMLLARHGLQVLVLERSAPGSDPLSTHALMRGGVMQLRRWGLLDAIIAGGAPPVRRTRFTYAGERIEVSIKASHGVDALYAPRRTLLDPTLVAAAADAGATVQHRSTVTDLLWRRDRVVGVRVRGADGRVRDVSAPLVVGADGINSIVAHLARAEVTRRARHATSVTYGYWSDLDVVGYEWVFRPDACSGAIPTNGGQTCVFAGGGPGRVGRGGVDVIAQLVGEGDPELGERLARANPPTGTRTWAGKPGYMRRAHGAGWALVGDAAYFKDPIGAHGLTDALRDAELLSRAVVEGLSGGTEDVALAEYERTRDRISVPLFETVDRIASNDWDDAEIGGLLRQLSSSMAAEVDTLAELDQQPAR